MCFHGTSRLFIRIRTQLVGDPAFLSADMKVLAICKYGKIIRLAGISQGDPDGEAFFASHLKFLRGEHVKT